MRSQVAISRAESYEIQTLRSSFLSLLDSLGGWRSFIETGEKVLLKPNLLSARTPERAVTTHPNLVKVVAQSLIDYGAVVSIGDSPGGADRGVARVFDNTGMSAVADELGIEQVNFEASGARTIQTEDGLTLSIARAIFNFDKIISISKLKTHSLMLFTGAIKNLFGTVPGFRKAEYHKKYPLPRDLGKLLVAIYANVPITLHIMDAVVGMEGNGPSSGELRDVGLILASSDGVALDSIAEHIIGIRGKKSITTRLASRQGLGVGDLEKIDILGGNLEDFVLTKPFKLPPRVPDRFIPSWLITPFTRLVWIRPEPIEDKCVRCGICAKNCPVDAIAMRNPEIPQFDYGKCITCMCCHELCPHDAINLRKSFLARRIK